MRAVAFVRAVSAGLALSAVMAAPVARADKVDQAIERLNPKKSTDFRVRTQAALALGASKSKRAVAPLCRGLGDQSSAVRAAAAAALGKLDRGGKQCLERRLSVEKTASVKATIQKAIGIIGRSPADRPPGRSITARTKVYIAIGKTTDKTGRNGKQVDELVRTAMAKAAAELDGYAVAPKTETMDQAKKLLAKHKQVKALYLSPKVQEPKYNGGNLTVTVEVAIFTYPGKALKGMIPVKLTQQDVGGKDEASENELIALAAERLVEKVAQNLDRID